MAGVGPGTSQWGVCVCLVSVSVAGRGGPRSFPSWKEISSGEGVGSTAGRRDQGREET